MLWAFDIQVYLTRKVWLLAGGHVTQSPGSISICGVTGFSSGFSAYCPALVAYNDLEVRAADTGNLHIVVNCMGRIWIICKPGVDVFDLNGKLLIVVLALYGFDPVVLVGVVKLIWQRV